MFFSYSYYLNPQIVKVLLKMGHDPIRKGTCTIIFVFGGTWRYELRLHDLLHVSCCFSSTGAMLLPRAGVAGKVLRVPRWVTS